jgi:hypothetical protein
MVAAVAIAITDFFMSEIPSLPELQPVVRPSVPRSPLVEGATAKFNIDERLGSLLKAAQSSLLPIPGHLPTLGTLAATSVPPS